jgi:uncharacterized protein (TIGR02300 family)
VAKPEWGMKRVCLSCGTRYYDMRHDPIVCPKCGAAFDIEAVVKTRRTRVQAVAEPVIEPIVVEEIDADLAAPEVEGEEVVVALPIEEAAEETESETEVEGEEKEEEEEEIIEDASELGEDEDDMAEVIDNVDDEDER